jgi:hypothetical protein
VLDYLFPTSQPEVERANRVPQGWIMLEFFSTRIAFYPKSRTIAAFGSDLMVFPVGSFP